MRASAGSVAVYDIATPAILAVSRRAAEQLGFVDVDLAEVNIVDGARDPESTRKLLSLIRDGQLKEWKVRSWLRTPGGGFWEYASGRAIDLGGRRLGLVSYPSPLLPETHADSAPVNEGSIAGGALRTPFALLADNPAWNFPDNAAWNAFMDFVHSGTPDVLPSGISARARLYREDHPAG